jgi:uncharacterized protein YbaA (DUF1428 family)
VDGFVLVVPKKNLAAYRRLATLAGKVWREHGALAYFECVGDDLNIKFGLPFPRLAKARRGDAVVFSWIAYKSRAHRDRVNVKVMKDQRLKMNPKKMPFDMKRMSCGGFKVLVRA